MHDIADVEIRSSTERLLADAYKGLGRNEEAEKLYRSAIDRWGGTAEIVDNSQVSAIWSLANLLSHTQRKTEAATLFRSTRPFVERLGLKHFDTLQLYRNLAICLNYDEKEQALEAEELLRRCYEGRLETLGATDKATNVAAISLSEFYRKTKQFSKLVEFARAYLQSLPPEYVESLRHKKYGAEAYYVIVVRTDLAKALRKLAEGSDWHSDEVDAWEEVVRETLQLKRDIHGQDHQDTIASRKELASVLMRRAEQLVLESQYPQAFEVLSEISELTPDRRQAESLAALQVYLDEENSARRFSQQLWERAQVEESGSSPASRWVVDALLSPHHGLDLTEITEFLVSIPADTNGHMPRLALGLTYYRAGSFEQAIATIDTEKQGPIWIRPISSFVHAMACAKSGDSESARKSFDEAVTRMDKVAPTPTTGVELKSWEPPHWVLWCLYHGLKREASAVLAIEPPKPLAQSASEK